MSKRLKSSDLIDLEHLTSHLKMVLDFNRMRVISLKDLNSIIKVHLIIFREGDNNAANKKF